MVLCVAFGCNNTTDPKRSGGARKVGFYKFPKDKELRETSIQINTIKANPCYAMTNLNSNALTKTQKCRQLVYQCRLVKGAIPTIFS